jgi:hypothetical protein
VPVQYDTLALYPIHLYGCTVSTLLAHIVFVIPSIDTVRCFSIFSGFLAFFVDSGKTIFDNENLHEFDAKIETALLLQIRKGPMLNRFLQNKKNGLIAMPL